MPTVAPVLLTVHPTLGFFTQHRVEAHDGMTSTIVAEWSGAARFNGISAPASGIDAEAGDGFGHWVGDLTDGKFKHYDGMTSTLLFSFDMPLIDSVKNASQGMTWRLRIGTVSRDLIEIRQGVPWQTIPYEKRVHWHDRFLGSILETLFDLDVSGENRERWCAWDDDAAAPLGGYLYTHNSPSATNPGLVNQYNGFSTVVLDSLVPEIFPGANMSRGLLVVDGDLHYHRRNGSGIGTATVRTDGFTTTVLESFAADKDIESDLEWLPDGVHFAPTFTASIDHIWAGLVALQARAIACVAAAATVWARVAALAISQSVVGVSASTWARVDSVSKTWARVNAAPATWARVGATVTICGGEFNMKATPLCPKALQWKSANVLALQDVVDNNDDPPSEITTAVAVSVSLFNEDTGVEYSAVSPVALSQVGVTNEWRGSVLTDVAGGFAEGDRVRLEYDFDGGAGFEYHEQAFSIVSAKAS